jgi:hypothetical protein
MVNAQKGLLTFLESMADNPSLVHKSGLDNSEGIIYFAPILHGKLEFAQEVQRQFFTLRPEAIAVEFPKTLETPITRAVRRLPFLSVILYREQDGTYVYLPIEPTDGLVEAIRLGIEHQVPIFFVDRDTEGYPRYRDPMPDSYSITKIGYSTYCEMYRKIQENPHLFSTPGPSTSPSTSFRTGPGKISAEGEIEEREEVEESETSQQQVDQLREATMTYHLQWLRKKYTTVLFVCGLAHYGQVMNLLDTPQVQPIGRVKRYGVTIANLHENSSREIMSEVPFIAAEYERNRTSLKPLDRLQIQEDLLQKAREQHLINSKEEITPQQFFVLRKFARNYALVQHQLTPDFYQLVIATRGAVNDNYAYEVWDLGSTYPWQDKNPKFSTIELQGEDLYLNQKKIRFHRKFRTLRKRLVPVPVRTKKKEKRPGEWKETWEGKHICSHPPEDIVVEGYGRYIQKKTTKMLAEENHRTIPFMTSLMDGIDIRETIRNWHEKRLYVMENVPVRGKVGSVVIIFDEDDQGGKGARGQGGKLQDAPLQPCAPATCQESYPWKMTWLGEHQDESDMAFYATPAGEQVVGPGISRCLYGGFMLTYPPLRVYDIWKDHFFDKATTKSERLLLAAIDYSVEKLIAYVAAKPPRSWCYSFANKINKKVVYIPIGQFSAIMLKKIQVFHVLDGYDVRKYAKEYIW